MTLQWLWTGMVATGLGIVALVLGVALARCRRRVERLEASLVGLERDFRAACAAQRAAGDRLLAVEQTTRHLHEAHTRLEMKVPTGQQYRQAIALVEHGADADALMTSCGLARGEAELVRAMHAVPGAAAAPRSVRNDPSRAERRVARDPRRAPGVVVEA